MARDHGGGIDAAILRYGGIRTGWLDLSTGINPVPYLMGDIAPDAWTALPDSAAQDRLIAAARAFWEVPEGAIVIAAPGASALIARMPALVHAGPVYIPAPTYNEHAAAFAAAGFDVVNAPVPEPHSDQSAQVFVHPNNPTGSFAPDYGSHGLTVIDESFCDICPEQSLIARSARPGTVILKSFGKFWGLAGLRLGFAIGHPDTLHKMGDLIGPWAVSGPALEIGAQALTDFDWAGITRTRLKADARRLDDVLVRAGARVVGGCDLFRLYDVNDAAKWQDRLARGHVWSRVFPYSDRWLRLGLPAPDRWDQLEAAL